MFNLFQIQKVVARSHTFYTSCGTTTTEHMLRNSQRERYYYESQVLGKCPSSCADSLRRYSCFNIRKAKSQVRSFPINYFVKNNYAFFVKPFSCLIPCLYSKTIRSQTGIISKYQYKIILYVHTGQNFMFETSSLQNKNR